VLGGGGEVGMQSVEMVDDAVVIACLVGDEVWCLDVG
jgi:hypothetical protein